MRRYAPCAKILIFAAVLILLSACNLPQKSPAATQPASTTPFTLPTPPPTAALPSGAISTVTPGEEPSVPPATDAPATTVTPAAIYPDTPEGVVQAFVGAYPEDTNGMLQYLSASVLASLPAGGPGELLNVQGDVNGFLILSGSTVPQPPQAEVQGAFQAGTQLVQRTFNLVQENGRWVINGIQ